MFEGRRLVAEYKKLVGELRSAHFVKMGKNPFDIEPNYFRHSPRATETDIDAHFSSVVDFLADVQHLRTSLQQRVHLPARSAREKTALDNLDAIHAHLHSAASEHGRELLELHRDMPLPLGNFANTGVRQRLLAPPLEPKKVAGIAARHLRALAELK